MRIHVVGAGPAGSIAAMSALSAGHSVVVSEDHKVAGIPENCSGLFSRDGLESLPHLPDYRKFVIRPMHGAHLHFAGERISVRKRSPVGFVCDRAALDQALASRAEGMGAEINYGERIRGAFHSENVIGADGPLSSVARHFGFPSIKSYAATLQAEVPYRSEDPDMVEVFLSKSRFPGFFAWIIPHDEYSAEFGAGVALPNRAQDAWNRLLKLKGIDGAPKPRGAVIPISVRPRTGRKCGKYNVLLAGDAAGQVKSTTGGGVIFGGSCASIAGRLAAEPLRYEFEWRMRHGPDLLLHKLVHDHVSSLSDEGILSLGRRLKKLGCDSFLSSHGHMDRPTKMLGPALLNHMVKNLIGVS
ncbi:MAG TPA: FAD-dependent monooxygenase [Candidatus Bilamarchaeum sp.]|nr:FAD-dependent monooxygenase [Candidatus Bilamarchaeum sp.]